MPDIILSEETYNRIIRAVEITESQNNPSAQAALFASQQAVYAKVTGFADDDEKRIAKAIEVVWDEGEFEFRELDEEEGDPFIYDTDELASSGATLFTRTSIVSKTAMAEDDVFLLQYYPNLSETEEWFVIQTAGTTRAFVVITSVIDAATYIGDVLQSPNGGEVIKEGVSISVNGAASNEYQEGYSAFADVVNEDIGGGAFDDVYYIDGYLLG